MAPPAVLDAQRPAAAAAPLKKPLSAPTKPEANGGCQDAELLAGLRRSPKQIPCSYLYDSRGTALYNQITDLPEYYPFRTELALLQQSAGEIIRHIPPGAVLVELGCGCARKTAILQRALLARDGPERCTFLGIDVSADFLAQAKANLLAACPALLPARVQLVRAEYLEGLRQARALHPRGVLCVLWLGSSMGNLTPDESVAFFKEVLRVCGPQTQVLLGADLWKDAATLTAAYDDSAGVTSAFIRNGAANALRAAGARLGLCEAAWGYGVTVNAQLRQVEMYVTAKEALQLPGGCSVSKGERLLAEISRKFTPEQLRGLAYAAGFCCQAGWSSGGAAYTLQLLCTPGLAFQLCWADTDALFAAVPDWAAAPISLRHPWAFYAGHLAAFARLRLLPEAAVSAWDRMFSRGIDPDVADPSRCHAHPPPPPAWPPPAQIQAYVSQARAQMAAALASAQPPPMHEICMALEHERMHQETLCYMAAQQRKAAWQVAAPPLTADASNACCARLPAPGGLGAGFPEWERAAERLSAPEQPKGSAATHSNGRSNGHSGHSSNGSNGSSSLCKGSSSGSSGSSGSSSSDCWVRVPAGEVCLGAATDGSEGFVWDNEGPKQAPQPVAAFELCARPVSVAQFRAFLLGGGYARRELWAEQDWAVLQAAGQRCPATWTLAEGGEVWVHSPNATHHWSQVAQQPVACSLAEARAFAAAQSCRLLTEPEWLRACEADPTGSRLQLLTRGGWEWTASAFAPLPGWQPMAGYAEYSQDFFDGAHFTLRGAGPHTHPGLRRRSFRNFYQATYPHVLAKFRCCRSPAAAQ